MFCCCCCLIVMFPFFEAKHKMATTTTERMPSVDPFVSWSVSVGIRTPTTATSGYPKRVPLTPFGSPQPLQSAMPIIIPPLDLDGVLFPPINRRAKPLPPPPSPPQPEKKVLYRYLPVVTSTSKLQLPHKSRRPMGLGYARAPVAVVVTTDTWMSQLTATF